MQHQAGRTQGKGEVCVTDIALGINYQLLELFLGIKEIWAVKCRIARSHFQRFNLPCEK